MNKFYEELIVKDRTYFNDEDGRPIQQFNYRCGCWSQWSDDTFIDSHWCPSHDSEADRGRHNVSVS